MLLPADCIAELPGQGMAATGANGIKAQTLHHGKNHVDLHHKAKPQLLMSHKKEVRNS
jgi:hypothetical protein